MLVASVVELLAIATVSNGTLVGTRIGLFVGRSMIEGHGGRLWAEPGDGAGANCSFVIPSV
jgi:signal transduction histidine kinase